MEYDYNNGRNDGNWNITIMGGMNCERWELEFYMTVVMEGMNCEQWKLEYDYNNGRNEL